MGPVSTAERTTKLKQCARKYAWGLALLLVPAAVLMAAGKEGRVEKTFETNSTPRISISNLSGQVVIRGWDKSEVHAVYVTRSPRVEIDVVTLPPKGPAEKLHFATHVLDPLLANDAQIVDYTLDIPLGTSLEIRNPQGSVRVEGLHSDDASIESVGGTIYVSDFSGHLAARSVGGDIDIVRPVGRVEAYSITGNLHFVSPETSKLRANTTSGRILYEGDFQTGGYYLLTDYSGDMDIICPPSASFELSAKTVHGKFINSLPQFHRRRAASPLASANSLLGTHNTGDATVELTSFSGTIRIRQQAP
jgi:hypothetical protein